MEAEVQARDLSRARIAVTVNGRECTSPLAQAARRMIRAELGRQDAQRRREDGSDLGRFLKMAGKGLSADALLPFLT